MLDSRRAIVVATALLAAGGCDQRQAPPTSDPSPANAGTTRQPSAPTDWADRLPDFPLALLEPVWMREEHVPRIEYDPALSTHTPQVLREALESHRAEIERLIDLADELPVTIRPLALAGPELVASGEHLHLPRGRLQNGLRVLRADAVQLHENGQDAESFRRLGAAARFSLAFARQKDEQHVLLGLGTGATTLYETRAVVQDGLREPPATGDVTAILDLADWLEANTPIDAPELVEAIEYIRTSLAGQPDP